jgi:hypothetical protein
MQVSRMCAALVLFAATTSDAANETAKKEPPVQEEPAQKKKVCDDGVYHPKQTDKFAKYDDLDSYAYVKPECLGEF